MGTVNNACSILTLIFCMSYLSLVVWLNLFLSFNGIEFVCLCSYISQLPFSAYASKGIRLTKVYRLSSESLFCIN